MSEQLSSPTFRRQPHYSFMRPGDFIWFVFLLVFTSFKFWSAYTLTERFYTAWNSYAIISLLAVIWYSWIRFRRRNCCADSGEFMITILLPQAYQMAFKHYTEGDAPFDWVLFWMFTLLLIGMAFQVLKAPRIAKEMEEMRTRLVEVVPRFSHIENP